MEEQEKTGPKLARFTSYDGINKVFNLNNGCSFCVEFVLSKRYRFIKWLVDKDKIDFDNRELKDEFMVEFERYPTFHGNTYNRDFNENGLLMLLAISENPISDLISYLK